MGSAGPAALWHEASSGTRDWTTVPWIGRQILNHWTTREAPLTNSLMVLCCFPSEVQGPQTGSLLVPPQIHYPWQEAADWGLWTWRLVCGTWKCCGLRQVNFIFLCPFSSLIKEDQGAFLPGPLWGSDERTHTWCSVNISGKVFCPGHALVPNILHFWLFSRRIWCPPVSVHLFILLPLPDPTALFGEILSVFLDSVKMSPF